MFHLRLSVSDYLDVEVFGETRDEVMELFSAAVKKRAKKGGWADKAQDEIDRVKPEWIEEVVVGVRIEGEYV